MTRRCDGCTMCCFLPEVTELDKPLNTWCEHCAVGTGCTIYRQRPQGCRDFTCLWLANPAIPERLRPDRTGVVFEALPDRIVLAMVDPRRPRAWQDDGPQEIIANLLRHGTAVVVTCENMTPVLLPPPGRKVSEVSARLREMVAAR